MFLCLNWLFWYIIRLFVTGSTLFRVNVEKKLYFNFLRWGALLWKFALIGKLCYLKNCVTLKAVIFEKLLYSGKLTFFWTIILFEELRWGALLVKCCVGVRYFKILLYCKNVALFESWFCSENCVIRNLCYAEKLRY